MAQQLVSNKITALCKSKASCKS